MAKKFQLILFSIFLTVTNINAQFTLQEAFPNLSFSNPLFLTHAGDNTNRIFVVEQAGKIKVFSNSQSALSAKVFLDITDRVVFSGEMGLLGLAFHPNYENNGYIYVNYTTATSTVISRFKVSNNPDSLDKTSEFQLMTFTQPYSNHKGGWIGFGPNDGYLYIATGDGGSSGDPQNYAQSTTTLLGKILRIDVDGGISYSIPPTNPFYSDPNVNIKKEIYAWGLRNPWRCSFDPITGRFWAADVGQGAWEEIDIIENGKNYGWRCSEGNHNYNTSGCNYPEYIIPIYEYSSNSGNECSITGGYVYRGLNVPELEGKYIYGDYCSNKIWALTYDGINPTTNQLLLTASGGLTSFGVDQNQELYLTSFNGNIYRFTPTSFPVELSSFSAVILENGIKLKWETETEVNNYGFSVERKTNTTDWMNIGFVSGNGNSNSPKNYFYTDDNPVGSNKFLYRLKQIDNDGAFEYSSEIQVAYNGLNQFKLNDCFPNPFNGSTVISWQQPVSGFVSLKIYDALGNEVAALVSKTIEAGKHNIDFDASNLSSGMYIYKLHTGNFLQNKKMILLK